MTKEEIIKALRDMARYPTVTLPRDSEALKVAADLLAQPEHDYKDLYEKEKRKSAMWLAKYEEIAGPAPKAIPMTEPEQEPVAWISHNAGLYHFKPDESLDPLPLYLTPPQHKPLTHEQRVDLLTKFEPHKNKWEAPAILIDMVEAAHGIKENT